MSDDAPAAGWYPNPDGTGGLRWWSGVGWTEYTREAGPADATQTASPEQATEALPEPEQPAEPEPETQQTAVLADQTQWTNPWGQPIAPVQPAAAAGYAPYTPATASPLTPSGMRPLSDMFSDIARITRRAWFPILGISFIIWAIVSAVLAATALSTVDVGSLRRATNALLNEVQSNPDGTIDSATGERILADYQDAFSRLSPAAWLVLGLGLLLLVMIASFVQVAAVSRLSMDAASGQPVTWAAGWKSGFVGGLRLLGYWLLVGIIATLVLTVVIVIIALVGQLVPALAALLGVVAFFAGIAVGVLLLGRFVPVAPQAVVGRHALRWSWQHTKGKFWAVLGRYLLWSIAAGVIIQIISTVIAIPLSLIFLGQLTSASSASDTAASLELQFLMLPFSMALGAITVMGIAPIWRDLSDDPTYRSIDEEGQPVPPPSQ